jgi:dynein heavy chain
MQATIRYECRVGAQECAVRPLKEFVNAAPSQIALLGVQMVWTTKMTEALERNSVKDRRDELERKLKEVSSNLNDLTDMCLEDIPSTLIRTKIETLVTIQVHQRDLSSDIKDIYRANPHKGIYDFDW